LYIPTVYVDCRNHRIITDKEDIQERNWLNEGQVRQMTKTDGRTVGGRDAREQTTKNMTGHET
jgi:hypothetical protein